MKRFYLFVLSIVAAMGLSAQNVPISSIQQTTDANGISPYKDQVVTTSGVVTAVTEKNFWIQDAPGEWHGLHCFLPVYEQFSSPAIGDSVVVTGKVAEHYNDTEIKDISALSVISSHNTLPAVTEITAAQANTENFEGVLVKVKGRHTGSNNEHNWYLTDATGSVLIDNDLYPAAVDALADHNYTITGIIKYSFSNFMVLPREAADISDEGESSSPLLVVNSPANNSTVYSSDVAVEFTTYNFVLGTDGAVEYKVDGGSAEYATASPINITDLSDGNHTINLELVDMEHNSLETPVATAITFTVLPPEPASIYQIQYTTNANGDSPKKNKFVITSGVVTADFNLDYQFGKGYYISDGAGEWHGLYVFDSINTPAIGDSVVLQGKVVEYYNMTELKKVSNFRVAETNCAVEPTTVTVLQANSEAFESCLVTVRDVKCVKRSCPYGLWKAVNTDNDTLILKENKQHGQNVTREEGEHYDITGVIEYNHEFHLQYRGTEDVRRATFVASDFASDVVVYPNPAVGSAFVTVPAGTGRLDIVNSLGQTVQTVDVVGTTVPIDVSTLEAGLYFVKVQNERHAAVCKLIVN